MPVMKKALKIFGYTLLGLLILVLGLAAYIQFSPIPTYEVKAPSGLKISADSTRITEGRRITMTMCVHCHRGPDGKLSGDIWNDDDVFGKLYSANLTQHPDAGIGRYTDAELMHTLRTGIKRDGHYAGPFMMFRNMSDEDMAAIIAFLRSDAPEVQPSERRQPPAKLTFLGNLWLKMLVKPMPYPEKTIVAPLPSDKLAYGRYLVNGKWECFTCHSASFETNNLDEPEKSKGYLGGGNPMKDTHGNSAISANITPDRETGIGAWTEAQFAEALRFGKRPDGRSLSPLMPPMTTFSDEEVSAIWAYLQTVPTIKNNLNAIAKTN